MITSKKCMKKQLLNLALARYHEVSDLVSVLPVSALSHG